MKNSTIFIANISKFIGSFLILAFAFITFAHGQNCTLLPGWSPSTLADGQSRTGYKIQEATYTQSCDTSVGTITCISGSIANGNIYKYPSCIPHNWANCTTPTTANHLEYKTLYKSNTNSYTQNCQQLSQSLQCLNGVFTGGIQPWLYTYASCTNQNRVQCVDIWTNSYRDHGETIVGYVASTPGIGQTCQTLQRALTCINGIWSGGNQSSLFSNCTNPIPLNGCTNIRTSPTTTLSHGTPLNAYTSPTVAGTMTCSDVLKHLTCVNGFRSGNGTSQQIGLYSGCIQPSCPNIITGTGTITNGTFITVYTDNLADENNEESCSDFVLSVQCINGIWSGYNPSIHYTGCQNISSGSCYNNLSSKYVPHLSSVFVYESTTPTAGYGCDSVKIPVYCNAGKRYKGNAGGPLLGTSLPSSYYATCAGCILPRGGTLAEGASTLAFSYDIAIFPKTCSQYQTTLTCGPLGVIEGNRQTYQYSGCVTTGLPVPGVDLTLTQTPVRNNYKVAQGSSPEINIVFYNNGTSGVNTTDIPEGFLSCDRVGDDFSINIYTSRTLSSFSVASATKVGVNIRFKTIFTQALGTKGVICTLNPDILGVIDEKNSGNNIRTGIFEVVEADRFDLALSESIDPIRQNLEAAEGAVGTQGLQNFLFDKIMNVLVPLVIIIGILSAILGFYKLMFSSDENATKEGTRYIIYGIIGIIIIMSAKFIGSQVYNILNPAPGGEIVGTNIAQMLYNNILYPFIKLAIYLVLGAMFVILVGRVITFLFGNDADAQKKAGTLIGWNVISMLVIIGAKQIVEAIYGKQEDVIKEITNLGEVGSGILADKNIPIIRQVINYALGIASLVILVIIIIQTVKLLTKPDDPAQIKNIKNSLLYMFIGILVLGAGYLIVNFAIIN